MKIALMRSHMLQTPFLYFLVRNRNHHSFLLLFLVWAGALSLRAGNDPIQGAFLPVNNSAEMLHSRHLISDTLPPEAICREDMIVQIPASGFYVLYAADFDNGSHDETCLSDLKIRLYNDSLLTDSIQLDCDYVGAFQGFALRATDCSGNTAECFTNVEIQDKIPPTCTPPADLALNCVQFDQSLLSYGNAEGSDNCCVESIFQTVDYANFDTVCTKGVLIRNFQVKDCHGLSAQCSQRIEVSHYQDLYVKFPNDTLVYVCNNSGLYGKPVLLGHGCERMSVTFEDTKLPMSLDACYTIERKWKIINTCTHDPNASLLYVEVPNPEPNLPGNNPLNRVGPVVSPVQTPNDPWQSTITKITTADTVATNYSVYYDPNVNGYIYKQIIKVADIQDPVIQCPGSPSVVCDQTTNDAALWNYPYWWDPANGIHDVCEAPADICISAIDSCNGSDLQVEFELFLDLNNDGTMETQIKRSDLGAGGLGWNNILYNNLNGAGESRQFDARPVPADQKWGFALQESVSGKMKTACIKFNTQSAPDVYLPAQLPHGIHRIRWYVSDECGNQTECAYYIEVKDCKPPILTCQPTISVNVLPVQQTITLNATDLLLFSEDNCSLASKLQFGVRKCNPMDMGFPVDGNGNPTTNVTFDCTELGTKCVELWSIDLAGNAEHCTMNVIVGNNGNACGGSGSQTISGHIVSEDLDCIPEVTVLATSSWGIFFPPMLFNFYTGDSCFYSFGQFTFPLANIDLTLSKDDSPLNGVTTYDLVLISKHILGIAPLGSPYKMIAADANKSNSITTFDIVELRKLILGIYKDLPANESWRFIDREQVFSNPANPFADVIRENIHLSGVLTHLSNYDFIGVKVGDVNDSAVINELTEQDDRRARPIGFTVADREVSEGETFELEFKSAERMAGFQTTMELNGLEVAALPNEAGLDANNFGIFPGALTMSIDGQDVFSVVFRAKRTGRLRDMLALSSRITRSEAYDFTGNRLKPILQFDGNKKGEGTGFELFQNDPNPFSDKTIIGFYLTEPGDAELRIFDETSRLIFVQNGAYAQGYHTIAFDAGQKTGSISRLLYYTLQTTQGVAIKKMLQLR